MPGDSTIEWTEKTWNPVTGCTKVSPGCAHCYAETFAERWRGIPGHPYEQGFDLKLWPERLVLPLRWRKPRFIFVNSMSDLFHEEIPDDYIARVFGVMAAADHHVFQVLTKRAPRMRDLLRRTEFIEAVEDHLERSGGRRGDAGAGMPWPLPNVWLGTSIENRRFVARADELRDTPAAVRFISAEPLLGSLMTCRCGHAAGAHGARSGLCGAEGCQCESVCGVLDLYGIDWLIAGGESGPKHRRLDLAWMRDLRDACAAADVAYFVKQLGGSRPGGKLEDLPEDLRIRQRPAGALRAPAS